MSQIPGENQINYKYFLNKLKSKLKIVWNQVLHIIEKKDIYRMTEE